MRERHEGAALIVLAVKPCDGHFAAVRADGGAVDRTSVDAPCVVMHYGWRAPVPGNKTRDVDVPDFVGGSISEGDDHAFGCFRGGRRAAFTYPRFDYHFAELLAGGL